MSEPEESPVEAEQIYADLVRLYPNNTGFLRRYAELLLEGNQQTMAAAVLMQLHQVLTGQGDMAAAEELRREYPQIAHARIGLDSGEDESPFLRLADETILGTLHSLSLRHRVREGKYLFRKGDRRGLAYLVLDGELALMSPKDGAAEPVLLDLVHRGDVLGMDALLEGKPYEADAIANRGSTVLELPRKQLVKYFLEYPRIEYEVLKMEEKRHLVALVSSHQVLSEAPLGVRKHLVRDAELRDYEADEVIIRAGDNIDSLMLVVAGEAHTRIMDSGGAEHVLETVAANHLLGTMAVLKQATAMADLVADTKVCMLHMPISTVRAAAEAHAPLKESFLQLSENSLARTMQAIERLGLSVRPKQ